MVSGRSLAAVLPVKSLGGASVQARYAAAVDSRRRQTEPVQGNVESMRMDTQRQHEARSV
ncbi:hypothetical protein [Robbsia andropogonis]|nr:hypothetical protein [Robbsia andropogonis]